MKRRRLIAAAIVLPVLIAAGLATGWLVTARADQTPAEVEAPVARGLPLLEGQLDDLAARDAFMGVVLVADSDQILMRRAYGLSNREAGVPTRPEDRFRLASVSKQFTAAAILRLQDDGLLSIDDPVCLWIQPCPEGWADIRLSHLLSHTSGLPDLMDRPGWGQRRITPATLSELTAETMDLRPRFPPGSRADYNNAGFNLLATVVERAGGMPFETYLQQAFFTPLGMADTGSDADDQGHGVVFGYTDTNGVKARHPLANVSIVAGAGALYSTVDDMLKWQRALHGGLLLSPTSYAQMVSDHAPADQGLPEGARPRGWGLGLFTGDLATGTLPGFSAPQVYHTGSWAGFRNLVTYEPREGLYVIVLTNNYHQQQEVFLITQQALAEAMGQPFPYALKS